MWYAYNPHWHIPDDYSGTLLATTKTHLKRKTTLSWETEDDDRSYVKEGTQLRATHVSGVSCAQERSRHDGSAHHVEVVLTPRSEELVREMDMRWIVYWDHFRRSHEPGVFIACSDTCLKRSWLRSQTQPAHEKIALCAGEQVTSESEPCLPRCIAADAHQAANHREVLISRKERSRLRNKQPRCPLCKYFVPDRDGLLRDIHGCFTDRTFGPNWPPCEPLDCEVPLHVPQLALLVPHGGYCNSGYVAAHGFRQLADQPFAVAVIIGNNHASWNQLALCDQVWQTPLGLIQPEMTGVAQLQELGWPVNRHLHSQEHSIENQLPFLQFIRPGVRIIPVGVGSVTIDEAAELATQVARLVAVHHAVLLGTTDFSHEGPSYGGPALPMNEITEITRTKDAPLLQAVHDMDAARLLELGKHSSMCGAGAAAVLLLACHKLGLTDAEQLRYLVNTEVTPCGSTTGFASFAFRPPA